MMRGAPGPESTVGQSGKEPVKSPLKGGKGATPRSFIDSTSGAILNANALKFDLNGVIGGGQIGYDWQQGNWVFGLEGDI
jgi:hypothetical protein